MNTLPFEQIKREIIFKQRAKIAKTLPKRTAEELIQCGIINLDKPKGPKSIHCVNMVREIIEIAKAGHAGTLDPAVTGVLPVGLGRATKILPILSLAGKVYTGTMHFHKEITKEKVLEGFKKFTGIIKQTPPSKSAVAKREREREVYWLNLISIKGKDVEFETGVQHGTYIRTLCIQIGEYIGIPAHMTLLRRIQAGPMKIKDSVAFEFIKKNYKMYLKTKSNKYVQNFVTSPEEAMKHLPSIWIDDGVLEYLLHGSPVFAPGILAFTSDIKKGSNVAIFDDKNSLLGLGIAEMPAEEIKTVEKGLVIKTDVVLIQIIL